MAVTLIASLVTLGLPATLSSVSVGQFSAMALISSFDIRGASDIKDRERPR